MSNQEPQMCVAGLIDDLRQISPDGTFHILTKQGCLVVSPGQTPSLIPMMLDQATVIETTVRAAPTMLPLYCERLASLKPRRSEVQRLPPGFGATQTWPRRAIDWYERNPRGPQHSGGR